MSKVLFDILEEKFTFQYTRMRDGFGGLVVCVPASSSRVRTRPKPLDFFCVKNPRPAFLRRGS
jgi:hypothetical protein